MKKSIKLFLTFVGICLSVVMPCQLFAYDNNDVKSRTEFKIDDPKSDLSKIKVFVLEEGSVFFLLDGKGGPNKWVQYRYDGNVELFQETSRDEWTLNIKEIYPAAKVFHIDFFKKIATWEGQGNTFPVISSGDKFSN
jgi:hypothetical protein